MCCVCCWPLVSIPLPNYEVVGLQPQAVDITNLGSVHPPSKFQDPLRQICMPVTGQDKKGQKIGTFMATSVGAGMPQ